MPRQETVSFPNGDAGKETRRLPANSCGEQTSSEPRFYHCWTKGKTMPEQKTNYMSQLDEWTQSFVIEPLMRGDGAEAVKKAVREKVLESYRNGQAAKPQRTWKK